MAVLLHAIRLPQHVAAQSQTDIPYLPLSVSLSISPLLNLKCQILHAPFPYRYDPLFSEHEFPARRFNPLTQMQECCVSSLLTTT